MNKEDLKILAIVLSLITAAALGVFFVFVVIPLCLLGGIAGIVEWLFF